MKATRVRQEESSAADDISPAFVDASSTREGRWPTAAAPLAVGSRLLGCEVQSVIGQGGFSVVYRAEDLVNGRQVALREYLPASMIYRAGDSEVEVAPEHDEMFGTGLRSFLNEARLLSRFDHPSLVKVLQFGRANGTAYMVMPLYEGMSLERALQQNAEPLDERQMHRWLDPLLDALKTLHAANCIHRDIAPGNILITHDGPLLLDFGAPRRVTGHAVARNEAPMEMFGDAHGARQGPWTDLYALASVAYGAITGRPPMPAQQRMPHDGLEPLSKVAAGRYSVGFLAALDRAMAVQPADRPQTADAFWTMPDADEHKAVAPLEMEPARVAPLSGFWTEPADLVLHDRPSGRRVPFKALLLLLTAFVIGAALLVNGVGRKPAARPVVLAPKATLPPPPVPVPPPADAMTASDPDPDPEAKSASTAAATATAAAVTPGPDEPVSSISVDVDKPSTTPKPAPPGAGKKTVAAAPSARVFAAPGAKVPVSKKCTEILQQASLEPLGPAQAAFLKRECHQ